MGTSDDSFWADGSAGMEQSAFENESSSGPAGTPVYRFGMIGYGSAGGVVGCGGQPITRLLGPYSTFAGVHGTARDFTGVAGTSVNRVGVYGQVEDFEDIVPLPLSLHAGVLGTALTQPGVVGISQDGPGVEASSGENVGVRASCFRGIGVIGDSRTQIGVWGFSGGAGPNPPMNLPSIAGVFGTSDEQAGVIGTSNRTAGVLGFSNNVGVYGVGASYAGIFQGNFLVVGGTKAAAVPFPDGTQRILYCMESPELWFEDFGTAKLKRGRAVVKLDADFVKVIKRGDYHVFFTPRGDCHGLYVRGQGAASFEVRELARGKSSVAFSYRIVGRRKDISGHRRFAKFEMPAPPPAPRARRPALTRAAFIAELERRARARATPAMRKSDREVAAMPPAILIPGRHRPPARRR